MRILITGGRGQLAADLVRALARHDVVALGRDELDIATHRQVVTTMEHVRPDVVINTAAFHRVDLCESEPEQSFLVNAAAPQRLAATCRDHGATLVQISTDYVFGGEKNEPYDEEDTVQPLSVYGASKAAGELAVRCTTDRHLIIRTTGLYGHGGMRTKQGNFVETMLRLAGGDRPITVVADQVLTPTSTHDLAAILSQLIDKQAVGTFHVTSGGSCSWFAFAEEIFRLAGKRPDLRRTTQAERPMPAARPRYSVLGHRALRAAGLSDPPPWQQALATYMAGRPAAAETAQTAGR
ncbi:MAG: dTDP-4-dehydrorhamnose reductase [Chloroflexota bacterium]